MVLLETSTWYFLSTKPPMLINYELKIDIDISHLTQYSQPKHLYRERKHMQQPSPYITLSDEVQTALQAQQPVVALESTVIAHGLPYPANIEVAQAMESTIRAEGAIPATIGIHDRQINIGLTLEQITCLGTAQNVQKVSRRDLAITLAIKQLGATTVAGTMLCASMAGIRFFATGGIGGVHRGAQSTMDISADLTELSRSPVLVVCAGAKSILDLDLTLEYLETQGVPVIGW